MWGLSPNTHSHPCSSNKTMEKGETSTTHAARPAPHSSRAGECTSEGPELQNGPRHFVPGKTAHTGCSCRPVVDSCRAQHLLQRLREVCGGLKDELQNERLQQRPRADFKLSSQLRGGPPRRDCPRLKQESARARTQIPFRFPVRGPRFSFRARQCPRNDGRGQKW